MPRGLCARTATQALTNVTYRYVDLLANFGLDKACKEHPALAGGINTREGKLTCKAVAEAHGMKYESPSVPTATTDLNIQPVTRVKERPGFPMSRCRRVSDGDRAC